MVYVSEVVGPEKTDDEVAAIDAQVWGGVVGLLVGAGEGLGVATATVGSSVGFSVFEAFMPFVVEHTRQQESSRQTTSFTGVATLSDKSVQHGYSPSSTTVAVS